MSEHPAQTVTETPDSLNKLSERVIGCAIEVHRLLGPGLLERLYEDALVHELQLQDLQVRRQVPVQLDYKGVKLTGQRLDLVVEHRLVIEVDGGQHAFDDPARTRYLESEGSRVLRFWNNEVLQNIEGVLLTIIEAIKSR